MSLVTRIKHRFGPRQMEWFMAVITALWGAVLLLPADTFSGRAWTVFYKLAPENGWGTVMLFLGVARLGGLIVNGSRQDVTPWIRAVSAALGCLLWCLICFGFGLTGVISTWLAIYPVFAFAELVNFYRSIHEAGVEHAARPE